MLRQRLMLRWTSLFTNRLPKGKRPKQRKDSTFTHRLAVGALEDRRMLAIITVNSTLDGAPAADGDLTLREAVIAANTNTATGDALAGDAGLDEIRFAIPGAGPHTITIDGATGVLPNIVEPLTIDGYTEVLDGASSPNTNPITASINADIRIIIDGDGGAFDGFRIAAGGGGSTIRGLVINNFDGDGVEINAANNIIAGNFIGTDVTGENDVGNTGSGVVISGGTNNRIGGTAAADRNLISGNDSDGVLLTSGSTTTTRVLGNFIGTDKDGDTDLGNTNNGVRIVDASDNTIGGTAVGSRNLISGNNDSGVRIRSNNATGNMVLGNFIGTDLTGTADLGNSQDGIIIFEASNNTIGGVTASARNVISGNGIIGVEINGNGATGNVVLGNYIGTDVTGTVDLGNDEDGVLIDSAPGNTIGGAAAGSRNLISGNDGHGVFLLENAADNNVIAGNYIGTDVTGTVDLGNSLDGVFIDDGDNNTIGGTAAGAGNLISGNNDNGVHLGSGAVINGDDASGNKVQGNLIGTDFTGTADLGNSVDGVLIEGSTNNTIGGTTAAARNVISGNNDEGVEINGATATGNTVQGNFIGTDIGGMNPLGNSKDGVEIVNSPDNLVGGTAPGAGNVVAHNGTEGVEVEGNGATGNAIRRNSIFQNGAIGIDLDADGITANDVVFNDPDAGPNNLQNFPEFVGNATLVGNSIQLTYSVPSIPGNSTFPLDIEFFVADVDMQEGQTYFASDVYSAAAAPNDKMITIPSIAGLVNGFIVATATDANGNTSEFSAPVQVVKAPDRFEVNNSIADATVLGSELTVIERDLSIHEAVDEDFFKITAHDTGKLVFRTFFIHDDGDLQLEVQDMFGNVITIANNSSSTVNMEEVVIPVVAKEMYFVHVTSVDGLMNCYDLEIENFPAPIPEMPVLHPDDDNGVSGTDNITSVDDPRIFVQADLANFTAWGIDILNAAEAAGGVTDGAAVEVFVNGVSQGFADPVGASNTLFQFQLDSDVLDNGLPIQEGTLNFVTAAVRIFDGQSDAAGMPSPASGRTLLSKPLELVTIEVGAQIGTWAAGSVLIDSNGNLKADPYAGPLGESDTAYRIGFDSDYIFAGKFNVQNFYEKDAWEALNGGYAAYATGFDTIAAYGRVIGNEYRWLIDIDGNGAINPTTEVFLEPAGINGYPVAGNFDGNPLNGDEVGLFDGRTWYFDTDHDFNVDTSFVAIDYSGFPIAGDFDGDSQEKNGVVLINTLVDVDHDGDDDVATYIASSSGGNLFSVDLNTAGPNAPIVIDGLADFSFQVGSPNTGGFGFAGMRERPVAADFNADGIDDFGLWVPDGIVPVPNELSEWYLLLSGDDPFTFKVETSVLDRIQEGPLNGFVPFSPEPFGNDLYAQFGNTFSLPIAGRFAAPVIVVAPVPPDPPVVLVTAITIAEPAETSLVVAETSPIVAKTSRPTKLFFPRVKKKTIEEVVETPVEQMATELVDSTPNTTSASKEPAEAQAVEIVSEQLTETEQLAYAETEPTQSLLLEDVTTIVELEVATPETPVEVVAEQVPAEPEPEVVAASEAVVVKVTTEAQAEEIPVALVDPPVPMQSRSRVRSLSFGGSRAVASVSTQSVPPPVVKPAESQLPVAVEIVVEAPTSEEVFQAPVVEIATGLSTSSLPTSGTTKSIPNKTATLITLVLAPDPTEIVGEDAGNTELPAHGATSFPVSEQSKGDETDLLPQDTATDLNVSPSTSRRRTRTLIYVQAQSNDQTSPQTPSLATGNTADTEQLAYLGDLTNAGVDPTQEKTAMTDAAFDNASQLEFNRVDAEVVDELSRLNQDSTEEFESRIQHELLTALADD